MIYRALVFWMCSSFPFFFSGQKNNLVNSNSRQLVSGADNFDPPVFEAVIFKKANNGDIEKIAGRKTCYLRINNIHATLACGAKILVKSPGLIYHSK